MPRVSTVSLWRRERAVLILVTTLSLVANLLALTGPLYMLQVYDRVLTSRSLPTLVALSGLAIGLYLALGLIEYLRTSILVRVADRFDQHVLGRLLVPAAVPHEALLQRLDGVRASIASPALTALFDLPWLPIYLLVIMAMSQTLAFVASCGIVLLVAVTVVGQALIQRSERAYEAPIRRRNLLLRHANPARDSIAAMGMRTTLHKNLQTVHDDVVVTERRLTTRIGWLGAVTRTLRNLLQAAVIGVGAYLALGGEVSAGAIIAASILAGRAMQPAEQVLAHWSTYARARQDRHDLLASLPPLETPAAPLSLPRGARTLVLEPVTVIDAARSAVLLRDIAFEAKAGEIVGIVGPSGSGKSTLLRTLVGVLPIQRGHVRLDGADVRALSDDVRARDVGYLAQDLQLLPGSVSEIIARHRPDAPPETIIAAAKAAGVHELILKLPDGYDTRLEADGFPLSPGQQRRVALARALYGDSLLVVLDDPNASLDADGTAALQRALAHIKSRGGIGVVATHQQRLLAIADRVVELDAGRVVRIHTGPAAPPRRTVPPRLAVAHSTSAPTHAGALAPSGEVTP